LVVTTDDLAPARLAELRRTRWVGATIDVRHVTESTNDDARVAALAGAGSGHTVVADRQTAGRGSRGRRWSSPPGDDLFLSVVTRPSLPPERLPLVTLAAGLAVRHAAAGLLRERGDGRAALVKWPNDVLVGDRKCAGILVETSTTGTERGAVIIGVGINVNRVRFEPDIAATATSLRGSGERFDRGEVLCRVLLELELQLDRLDRPDGMGEVARELERHLAYRGEPVRCGDIEGTLVGIGEFGSANIAGPEGTREASVGPLMRVR
jgi:BirA family biotin operon repressor/biotin-[acetyl-CoA-carboxylase] ligase